MNKTVILKFLGIALLIFAVATLVPIYAAYYSKENAQPWLLCAGIYCLLAIACLILGRRSTLASDLGLSEGITATVLAYISISAIAGIGLWQAHGHCHYIEAWFEAMSGLTTTGSSVFGAEDKQDLYAIAQLSNSIIMWRALLQWLGGICFVIISIALIPLLSGGTGSKMHIAEIPGLNANQLSARLSAAGKIITLLYLIMTLGIFAALLLCGLNRFDSLCHAMSTISTGGFSTFDHSIEGFRSKSVEWVLIFSMLLAALNFSLLVAAVRGRPMHLIRNTEAKMFAWILGIAWAGVALILFRSGMYTNHHDIIRDSLFQVVSLGSSTGFSTGYDTVAGGWSSWPSACIIIFILLMACGGCASSTAGGIKILRLTICIAAARRELRRFMEPARVSPMTLENRPLNERVILQVGAYIALFGLTLTAGTFLFCLFGNNLDTSFGAALTALSNVGPGLAEQTNGTHFRSLNQASLILSMVLMLLGRLELIGVLITLRVKNWRE